jgi:predicted phage terminase large subunit-like protein
VDALAEHLQAVAEGQIRNLAIAIPPGCAKSLTAAVQFPAWCWISDPGLKFLFASYSAALSVRDSVRCRRLVTSPWFQERWADKFQLAPDQSEKSKFENTRSGSRTATSVGGVGTGVRCDVCLIDDLMSVSQADSEHERESALDWFFSTLPSRLNDQKTGRTVVIGQRLHQGDVIGEIVRRGLGYEILSLPAQFDSRNRSVTCLWQDPRTEDGQLLWPDKLGEPELDRLRKQLGSSRFNAQYNQSPSSAGGKIWKREWIRTYSKAELPVKFDKVVLSLDAAFKDSRDSDFVALQAWGVVGEDKYLLDRFHQQVDFLGTLTATQAMAARWPGYNAVLVEDKANGSAILSTLRGKIRGLISISPSESKIARAMSAQPQFEAGQICVPHEQDAPWISEVINEWCGFPNAKHDDETDCTSQVLNWLRKNTFTRTIVRP